MPLKKLKQKSCGLTHVLCVRVHCTMGSTSEWSGCEEITDLVAKLAQYPIVHSIASCCSSMVRDLGDYWLVRIFGIFGWSVEIFCQESEHCWRKRLWIWWRRIMTSYLVWRTEWSGQPKILWTTTLLCRPLTVQVSAILLSCSMSKKCKDISCFNLHTKKSEFKKQRPTDGGRNSDWPCLGGGWPFPFYTKGRLLGSMQIWLALAFAKSRI